MLRITSTLFAYLKVLLENVLHLATWIDFELFALSLLVHDSDVDQHQFVCLLWSLLFGLYWTLLLSTLHWSFLDHCGLILLALLLHYSLCRACIGTKESHDIRIKPSNNSGRFDHLITVFIDDVVGLHFSRRRGQLVISTAFLYNLHVRNSTAHSRRNSRCIGDWILEAFMAKLDVDGRNNHYSSQIALFVTSQFQLLFTWELGEGLLVRQILPIVLKAAIIGIHIECLLVTREREFSLY